MQDLLVFATVASACAYLVRVFVMPSIAPASKPHVPLANLTRKHKRTS
ncbi:MAG: hypothetical protein HOW73_01920 [Polyangiaceae bacterium]|nr:hypothetical protein [Polyangiaceae bacterium]